MENRVFVIAEAKDIPEEEYRQYVNPMKTRRYGRLLKRALVTALKCIKESGVQHPDAIINGTAMGCLEESEKLLGALHAEGEAASMPTHFMQSTHNTIASLIGIYTKTHGYNSTYSHRKISYELALLDAFLQIKAGMIETALVCVNDEITSDLHTFMDKTTFQGFIALDKSYAVMVVSGAYLSQHPEVTPLWEIDDIAVHHHCHEEDTAEVVVRSVNGQEMI